MIALRDAVRGAARRLDSGGLVALRELRDGVQGGLDVLEPGELGDGEEVVRTQMAAFLARIGRLADRFPEPVPTTELDLPVDARFLRDMADYLTRRYGLEEAP